MEPNIGENEGLIQQMANYKFDSSIKVSYVFEDCEESDESFEEILARVQNGRNTEAHTEILATSNDVPSNDNNYCNATFNHSKHGFNNRHEGPVNVNENEPPQCKATNSQICQPHPRNSYTMPNASNSFQNKHTDTVTYPVNSSVLDPKQEIINLLDTVSENLIIITKYYHQYCTHYLKTRGKTNARIWYLTYKNHYFNLSYSVSVSLFLAQEHNQTFITKFIVRTLALANSKQWYNITFENLKQLVSDMIQWTKHKKKYLYASTNQLRQPMHTLQLESNYVPILNPNKINNLEDRNSVCLFSTGPPDKEIRISVDQTTLVNKSSVHLRQDNTVKTMKRGPSVLDDKVTKRHKTNRNISDTCNPTISQTSTWNPPAYNHINKLSLVTANICNNATDIPKKINSGPGHNNNDFENNEQPLILRSVSRDSGFGSPILSPNDNTPYLNYVENPQSIPQEAPTTQGPVLFPNGPCKVCSTSTKKMCIGCYKEYYCSYLCQKVDWPFHVSVCRPSHQNN